MAKKFDKITQAIPESTRYLYLNKYLLRDNSSFTVNGNTKLVDLRGVKKKNGRNENKKSYDLFLGWGRFKFS